MKYLKLFKVIQFLFWWETTLIQKLLGFVETIVIPILVMGKDKEKRMLSLASRLAVTGPWMEYSSSKKLKDFPKVCILNYYFLSITCVHGEMWILEVVVTFLDHYTLLFNLLFFWLTLVKRIVQGHKQLSQKVKSLGVSRDFSTQIKLF